MPLAACETWLRHGGPSGVQLRDYEGEPPKLLKGENGLLDAIERLRRRVARVAGRSASGIAICSVSVELLPSSACASRSRHWPCRVRRAVVVLVELDGPIEFADAAAAVGGATESSAALAFAEVPDTVALIAWLHRDR